VFFTETGEISYVDRVDFIIKIRNATVSSSYLEQICLESNPLVKDICIFYVNKHLNVTIVPKEWPQDEMWFKDSVAAILNAGNELFLTVIISSFRCLLQILTNNLISEISKYQ